jgi:3',5'-cyclic AMP phosphodiesterase CpdA
MLPLKNLKKSFRWIFYVTVFSCDQWFSYSPYESQLQESYVGTTKKNLELIKSRNAGDARPFKVALLSDTHYQYRKLDDAISDINKRVYFDFVIVTGDIADNGLKQEFIFFHEIMKNLTIPYFTVIGNHDYLANGEDVYSEMYGAYNYTFVVNNVKFVLFDNVRWESEKVPDFHWLETELHNNHGYDHVIPFSHIPPSDGQMEPYRERYHELLVRNSIQYSIHGHSHDFSLTELYGAGVWYHTISSPQFNAYTELTVSPDSIGIQKLEY